MSNIEDIKNIADMEKCLSVSDMSRYSAFSNNTRKLQFLLARNIVKNECGENIVVDENGAPTIKNGFISISHKDNLVVVAVSKFKVGIDIENITINRDFVSQSELLGLPKTDNKQQFYKNFVKYESNFKFGDNANNAHNYFYEHGDYLIGICTYESISDIQFILSGADTVRFLCAE